MDIRSRRYQYSVFLQSVELLCQNIWHFSDLNGGNKFFTAKLLRQGYRYHKLCKAFSISYRGHFELIEIYHVSMKKLLQQGVFDTKFYGDLVYKFKTIIGNPNPLVLSKYC